ncbi:Chromate resistance protein ChrB [Planomonospora sp. ID67723]|uniref:Chromate resistance protein ChrB n=1 Tax=Planomonospora sp. ID67723 TaxID=2738134 RepID=UPI0018C41F8E|nr:Chromate resistance protein ChrB [Planomonospora sp. ID67723]
MTDADGRWVLLAYKIPREPSSPRIAIWRKLERLGVARLGDGLVGLPADARTREQLDWIAQDVLDAGGSATVWLAVPAAAAQERAIVQEMRQARTAEYQAVVDQARAAGAAGPGERARLAGRLRAQLQRITRRDFFPPAEREIAQRAVRALTDPGAGAAIADGPPVSAAPDRPECGASAAADAPVMDVSTGDVPADGGAR